MQCSVNALVTSARLALAIALIATLAAATNVGLRFERHGGRVMSVQTGSMQPMFSRGDAVIVRPVAPGSLRVGDIVSYRSLHDARVIVTIHPGGSLTTKGDNLYGNDPDISQRAIIGQVRAVAPGLGHLQDWLRTPYGLIFAVYFPALLLIIGQVRRVVQLLHKRVYSLSGRR
jgi:signal peptidase